MSQNCPTVTLDPETWVDQYGNYLFHFALGRLRNSTDAENAVQETFLAALKARENFAGKSSERTWLIGILKHKIIDLMRKNYREKPVTDIRKEEEIIDQFFDRVNHLNKQPVLWQFDPRKLLEKREFWKVFHKCLGKLPQITQDSFTLREIDKIDSKEVCEILNITTSNLWIRLYRARLQLRQCLEVNWFENDKKQ